jgi:hypothetical protein
MAEAQAASLSSLLVMSAWHAQDRIVKSKASCIVCESISVARLLGMVSQVQLKVQ